MRPGTPFLIIVSLIHGYILWSWAIITPRWTVQPGYPLPESGSTVRMLSLLFIIAGVFVVNFALHQLRAKRDITGAFLNTMISVNIALALTLVLSQILDSIYPMFPMIGDTITQLRANPSILLGILFIINTGAAVSTFLAWGVFVGINKVLGNSTETDADADL